MSKIRIFALGGLNETGKSMYVVDVDNNILSIYNYLKSDEVYKMKTKGDIFLIVEELLYDK